MLNLWMRWMSESLRKVTGSAPILRMPSGKSRMDMSTTVRPGDATVVDYFIKWDGDGLRQVWAHKREPPHVSFGIRHSQYSSQLIVELNDW